jgi:aldehyde dehydrogenase (NAD+)
MAFAKNRLREGVSTAGLTERVIHHHTTHTIERQHFSPPNIHKTKFLIDGVLVSTSTEKLSATFNPSTEEIIASLPQASNQDFDAAVEAAKNAFEKTDWATLPQSQRGQFLYVLAQLIEENEDLFVYLAGIDAGNTSFNSKEDVRNCIGTLLSFCHSHGQHQTKLTYVSEDAEACASSITREPLGVVAGLFTAHNPLSSLAQVLAPAIAYGNTLVAVVSEDAPLCALKLAELVYQAQFPQGTVNILTSSASSRISHLAIHHNVDKVFLFLSERSQNIQ